MSLTGGMAGLTLRSLGQGHPAFVNQIRAAHTARKFPRASVKSPHSALSEASIARPGIQSSLRGIQPRYRKLVFHRRELL